VRRSSAFIIISNESEEKVEILIKRISSFNLFLMITAGTV
jgi:hypothetical protein